MCISMLLCICILICLHGYVCMLLAHKIQFVGVCVCACVKGPRFVTETVCSARNSPEIVFQNFASQEIAFMRLIVRIQAWDK